MSLAKTLIAWLCIAALCLLLAEPRLLAQTDPQNSQDLLKRIIKIWAERQTRFSTADLSLKSLHHDPILTRRTGNDSGTIKPTHIDYTSFTRMLIAGERIRYELRGDLPREDGSLCQTEMLYTSNGNTSKSFNKIKTRRYPSGAIYKDKVNQCVTSANTLFVLWALLPPAEMTYGFDVMHLSLGGKGIIDGRECLILNQKSSARQVVSYWVDPKRNFSILRYTVETDGKISFQMDCMYKQDPSGLWVPVKWSTSTVGQVGGAVESARTELESYRLNAKVTDTDFDIVFPTGTFVSDARPQPGIGRSGALDYVVMPDGGKRIVTWSERFASYEELLATPSGTAGRKPTGGQSQNWFMVINLVLLASVVTVIVFRRRAKARSDRSGDAV